MDALNRDLEEKCIRQNYSKKKKNTSSQPAAPHESYCSKNTVLKTCNRPTIIQNVL